MIQGYRLAEVSKPLGEGGLGEKKNGNGVGGKKLS